MSEAAIVLTIFDKVLKLVGLMREGKLKRNQNTDLALHALFKALNQTKSYVSNLNDGAARDRNREHDIAQLWHEASIPLRHVDRDLARRCFFKGSFWHEPDSWTEVQLESSRIALDQVLESTNQLLEVE